ncbi:MAG: TIGR01440 family protein [Bacillota bacterium]|nr:TIGR01440 family protein [Bacillota bacterium]
MTERPTLPERGGANATGAAPDAGVDLADVTARTQTVLEELQRAAGLGPNHLLVVGCSTSEVAGKPIGTAGSLAIAAAIWEGVEAVRRRHGFHVAWQCCEHLNRALVVERETMERFGLEEVTVVPHPKAGGSMATVAYERMRDPVVVEAVRAHAGVDIGDTLIGMHLRPVAVPVRPSVRQIGQAHVTMARTRPKLIGGERAVYRRQDVPHLAPAHPNEV